MAGGGGSQANRMVTFLEVNFSQNWFPAGYPDPYNGFVNWELFQGEESGSISITRSDGKTLYFDVTTRDGIPVVQIRDNVIRWSSYPEFRSDGPFQ